MKLCRADSPLTLLFVAGEGGHVEQARRLLATLDDDVRAATRCILITDSQAVNATVFDDCWVLDTCAPKFRAAGVRDLIAYARTSLIVLWRMARYHDIRIAFVTGPGFAVLPALGAKLLGAQLVVFESWSRFEVRSKCGKALGRFADHFYVQHEELLKVYPKATWVGLL